MALYGNTQLTGVERFMKEDEVIVTKTDTKGIITYANKTFGLLAEISPQEAIGKNHNIIRHPHMPRCVFKFLWDTIAADNEIFAYVLNRSLNGDHYWVLAHITPSYDSAGNIVAYHSNRRKPDQKIVQDIIAPLYANLLKLEQSYSSPKEGMNAALSEVVRLVTSSGKEFNEFVLTLQA
jgi:PAS domain S-box-containing protein